MFRTLVYSAILFCFSFLSHAAEVWAPGVSESGGWIDYNKSGVNDGMWADTAMCWAASSSNVIKWWMNQNAASLTSTISPDNPWEVFRAVYQNGGSTPEYALRWWIDGVKNSLGDTTYPSLYDEGGFVSIENKGNAYWPFGGFLSDVYSTSEDKVQVASNPNDMYGRAMTLGILDALDAGYALSLSVYSEAGNFQVAHAITLWGAEYTGSGEERILTHIWVTDSDDGKDTEQLVKYSIQSKESAIAISSGTMSGAIIRYAAGMRTNVIPEPATAALGLLALAGLVTRRRRA